MNGQRKNFFSPPGEGVEDSQSVTPVSGFAAASEFFACEIGAVLTDQSIAEEITDLVCFHASGVHEFVNRINGTAADGIVRLILKTFFPGEIQHSPEVGREAFPHEDRHRFDFQFQTVLKLIVFRFHVDAGGERVGNLDSSATDPFAGVNLLSADDGQIGFGECVDIREIGPADFRIGIKFPDGVQEFRGFGVDVAL